MCIRVVVFLLFLLSGCAQSHHENSIVQPKTYSVQPDYRQAAKLNVQIGLACLEKNAMTEAKEKFLQALSQAPNEPMAWYGMAYFLERTHDIEKAKEHYIHAINLNPRSGVAHNNYGAFLCRQGKYHESITQFKLAVADAAYLDPAGAYANAGICARRIPDVNAAEQFFIMALGKDPKRTIAKLQLYDLNKFKINNQNIVIQ